jgi:hypothetical protein
LPNIKNTRSIPEEIEKAYNFNKEILLKQITEYKPDVVISGNTLRYFYNDLGISDDVLLKPIDKSVTHYCIDKNVLYINAYHPSYGRFWSEDGRKVYCNNILEVIDVFFKNK